MSEALQKSIQEINKLPGLKKVKDEVKNLVAYLQSSKERKEQGKEKEVNKSCIGQDSQE